MTKDSIGQNEKLSDSQEFRRYSSHLRIRCVGGSNKRIHVVSAKKRTPTLWPKVAAISLSSSVHVQVPLVVTWPNQTPDSMITSTNAKSLRHAIRRVTSKVRRDHGLTDGWASYFMSKTLLTLRYTIKRRLNDDRIFMPHRTSEIWPQQLSRSTCGGRLHCIDLRC